MDRVADVIIFEHEPFLHGSWELGVVFTESIERCRFVAENTTKVKNHDRVTILLGWKLQKTEELGVIV